MAFGYFLIVYHPLPKGILKYPKYMFGIFSTIGILIMYSRTTCYRLEDDTFE